MLISQACRDRGCNTNRCHTIADVADHSVDMLLIVSLSSIGILAMVSSDPINSTLWLSTSCGKSPQSAIMTSFPRTPGGSVPRRFTWTTGGHWNQLFPVANMPAASVLTKATPKLPRAPYMLLWLSDPTHKLPGQTKSSSTYASVSKLKVLGTNLTQRSLP
jgi:hypothetical protein